VKFKILSGDFAAQYNKLLEEYKVKQDILDSEFDEKIEKLRASEFGRLSDSFPAPFLNGDKVSITPNQFTKSRGDIGEVRDCKIDFQLKKDQHDFDIKHGPDRYFELSSIDDEKIITLDGILHRVSVVFPSNELEKDWGKEERVNSFYSDELIKVNR